MKYALLTKQIVGGRELDVVVAFADAGIPCPDTVQAGDIYIGGGFHPRAAILTPPVVLPSDVQE